MYIDYNIVASLAGGAGVVEEQAKLRLILRQAPNI